MNGRFDADSLHSESDLFLRNGSVFKAEVKLNNAKIDGNVELAGSRFDGRLDAGQMHVGGYLTMNSAHFNELVLVDGKIAGQLSFLGASVDGPLNAGLLKVGGSFFAPVFRGVRGKICSQLRMDVH